MIPGLETVGPFIPRFRTSSGSYGPFIPALAHHAPLSTAHPLKPTIEKILRREGGSGSLALVPSLAGQNSRAAKLAQTF